jgi:putative DNA primase/helicase
LADGKTVRPLSWVDGEGWQFRAWPDRRPLYRLPEIKAHPKGPIVVVEGEKSADAANQIFPNSVVTTSSGGANAVDKTDWAALGGRRVLIWPDNDEAGLKYAAAVANILTGLGSAASIIDAAALASIAPDGSRREQPAGWDAADAIEEGRALSDLRRDAWSLAKPFEPPPS